MGKKSKIGLALGGGGARGLAHIGVLKVLSESNIPIDVITGTSMGSVVGAAYALYGDAGTLESIALRLPERIPQLEDLQNVNQIPSPQKHALGRILQFIKEIYLLNVEATRKSLVENEQVLPLLDEVFNEKTFSSLKIPFAAVATDLNSGDEVILNTGLLKDAILASMAIPGIFEPIEWNGRILVDGAVTSLVPSEAARKLGADVVIAVNVEGNASRRNFRRGLDILFQVDEIRAAELNRLKLANADLVIQPKIGHINWAQFSKVAECIRQGELAARERLDDIRNLIRKKQSIWHRLLPW